MPINNQLRIIEFFVLATAVLVTLSILIWVLIYSHYALDLADEGFHLNWMSNPWIYSTSLTQFGFIYHPLYLLFHGDIVLLRQANILITFGLAWVLCLFFFRATIATQEQRLSWRSMPMLALAMIIATCSLIYFSRYGWRSTPSYNSLIFQALLLASIGFLLAEKTVSLVSIIGWILIGVGGWLAFMGKPTSAAALGFVISVCLPLTGKFNFRLLAISLLTAVVLLMVSAWIIDGSLLIFIERLRKGTEVLHLIKTKHLDMFRIDALLMGREDTFLLVFSSVITFVSICLIASEKKILSRVGIGFTLLFAATSLMIISGHWLFQVNEIEGSQIHEYPSLLLILAIPLSALAFSLVLMRSNPLFKVSKNQWGFALYFLVLPYVSAFGTASNYWIHAAATSLFLVLAGLIIFMPTILIRANWKILLPIVMSGQLITVFLLQAAMEQPYFYQPEPLRQYDDVVAIGINKTEIILPHEFADFYRNIKKMVIQASFQAGTPIIDMTGISPGVLYAIGAKAIGQAWMVGLPLGSNDMAQAMLNMVSCADISEAWLLIDPDSPVRLSPTILDNFGISFEQDFEMAAELSIPPTNLVRRGVPLHRLQLWKPTRPIQYATAACEKKRNPL